MALRSAFTHLLSNSRMSVAVTASRAQGTAVAAQKGTTDILDTQEGSVKFGITVYGCLEVGNAIFSCDKKESTHKSWKNMNMFSIFVSDDQQHFKFTSLGAEEAKKPAKPGKDLK